MRLYVVVFVGVTVTLLVLYGLVEALDVPVLTEPDELLRNQWPTWAAGIGVCLLAADSLLPVPSSLVMLAHGALFGPVLGSVLSLIGRAGFAASGFAIGRKGRSSVSRHLHPQEQERAEHLLQRWGVLSVMVSRPVPVVAESISIMAGVSTLPMPMVVLASVVGSVPEALLYALAGSVSAKFQNAAYIWLALLALAGVGWVVARRWMTEPNSR